MLVSERTNQLKESISALERELNDAKVELEKALREQQIATTTVEQWQIEVGSLQKLIEVRQQRLSPPGVDVASANGHAPQDSAAHLSLFGAETPRVDEGRAEQTKVDWILLTVTESGRQGLSAAEVYRSAERAGVSMHPNYPYTVLKGLTKRGKLAKRGPRYFIDRTPPS